MVSKFQIGRKKSLLLNELPPFKVKENEKVIIWVECDQII